MRRTLFLIASIIVSAVFLWLALQLYSLKQGGPVAWVAHLGGFAIGIFGVTLFVPYTPQQPAKAAVSHTPKVTNNPRTRTAGNTPKSSAPKKRRAPVKKK